MDVQLTPEQEARLFRLADVEGVAPGQLLIKAAEQLFEDDAHFRAAVQKGIEQADHGEFIDETEMDARVSRLLGR